MLATTKTWSGRMLEQEKPLEADDGGVIAAAATPRLLVIDDDHLHRMIICRVATKAGLYAGRRGELRRGGEARAGDLVRLRHARPLARRPCRRRNGPPSLGAALQGADFIISGADDALCRETVRVAKSLNLNVLPPIRSRSISAILRYSLEADPGVARPGRGRRLTVIANSRGAIFGNPPLSWMSLRRRRPSPTPGDRRDRPRCAPHTCRRGRQPRSH